MAGTQVELQDKGLTLSGPDFGTGRYLNYLRLRDNCPQSWDAQTQDRVFDITAVPVDIHARPAQTDNPCEEFPHGLQYLLCIRNEATSGESSFADGAAAARDLKAHHPEDFEIRGSVTVPFRYTRDAMDLHARHQIILTDATDEVAGVTVSQHMADIFDLDQKELDRFYPAFHRFLTMLRSDHCEIEFSHKSGECVLFKISASCMVAGVSIPPVASASCAVATPTGENSSRTTACCCATAIFTISHNKARPDAETQGLHYARYDPSPR